MDHLEWFCWRSFYFHSRTSKSMTFTRIFTRWNFLEHVKIKTKLSKTGSVKKYQTLKKCSILWRHQSSIVTSSEWILIYERDEQSGRLIQVSFKIIFSWMFNTFGTGSFHLKIFKIGFSKMHKLDDTIILANEKFSIRWSF